VAAEDDLVEHDVQARVANWEFQIRPAVMYVGNYFVSVYARHESDHPPLLLFAEAAAFETDSCHRRDSKEVAHSPAEALVGLDE